MAKKSGFQMGAFVAGYDLSGDVGAINDISTPRAVFDVSNLDKTAVERLLGRADGAFSFANWFNDAAGQTHPALSGLPTTDVMAIVAMGNAVGDPAFFGVFKQVGYDPTKNADGSVTETIEGVGTVGSDQLIGTEWGKMLTALSDSFASASSAASYDDTAQTTDGVRAMIQPISLGSGTPTVVIEDSANDSTWATLVTFGTVEVNVPEEVMASGTVDQYLRITTTGTFTDLVIALAYRRGLTEDDVAYA